MIRLIQSTSIDPHFNLALEQYVFDSLDRGYGYFMLWQNENTIVVGKHQNTIAEINVPYVRERKINVVRRLSGGGAVYHDLGNVNFTFIADCENADTFDFSMFCRPVIKALESLGVHAELSGRNDMTIDGKKFSGNAQYMKQGRIMHHGTLMFDSDLDELERVLSVSKDKIESKGLNSVRSRVTNIKPYASDPDMCVEHFIDTLRHAIKAQFPVEEYGLSPSDIQAVNRLKETVYSRWEWNFGASPAYRIHKERRVDTCGKLEIFMDVNEGKIRDIAFYGDYFGNGNSEHLKILLQGCPVEESSLRQCLGSISIERYFCNMNVDTFISILLQ